MKLSLVPRRPGQFDPKTARDCLAANFALPGFGSVMGGRMVGYAQGALCALGVVLTFSFGSLFVLWRFSAAGRAISSEDDPVTALYQLWDHVKWALVGMLLFAFSWLWALATSLSLLREAKNFRAPEPGAQPPVIGPPG